MRQKPSYGTTKNHLFASSLMAWCVILALTAGAIYGSEQAVSFGAFAVPAMAAMIVGILGVHRHYGSRDFQASQPLPPFQDQPPFSLPAPEPPSPPYYARDRPPLSEGEVR